MTAPKPFTTDGCSVMSQVWWAITLGKGGHLPWRPACVEHDVEYWIGGTAHDRYVADLNLRDNVIKIVKRKMRIPVLGFLCAFLLGWSMYYAVRVGGSPKLPMPWRWGYGFEYPYKYQERGETLLAYAEQMAKVRCK